MVDARGICFFYFPADDLHRAVDHAVLFGEWLRQDSKSCRQPAIGEKGGQVASLAETVYLGLDDPDCKKMGAARQPDGAHIASLLR